MVLKVDVLWNINSCPVPSGYDPLLISSRIVSALRHRVMTGPITITALGNLENLDDTRIQFLRDIFSTGISLKHIPSDETETDLLKWIRQNPERAGLMLICGSAELERLARTIYSIGREHVITLSYPQREEISAWLLESFLSESSVFRHWNWETLLNPQGSPYKQPEALSEDKCTESHWVCTPCNLGGDCFERFIVHLESEEHRMKPVPPSTPHPSSTIVKSQPKTTCDVYWHISSCPVPPDYPPRLVGPSIVSALNHSGYSGPFDITAIGNLEACSKELLQELSDTGMSITHVRDGIQSSLFSWKSFTPPPSTLMLICDQNVLKSLYNVLYDIQNDGYTLLLSYPQREEGSDWLWKAFLADVSKQWLWSSLLEGDKKENNKLKTSETEDCFCFECQYAAISVQDFVKHLKSNAHIEGRSEPEPEPESESESESEHEHEPVEGQPQNETSVLWHIESCPVPSSYPPGQVGLAIESLLIDSGYSGPFTITAVGDLGKISEVLRELGSTGIFLKHVQYDFDEEVLKWRFKKPSPATGFKKPSPATVLLICGREILEELDFLTSAVYTTLLLDQGYTILLAYPGQQDSDTHWKDAFKVWSWPSLLKVDDDVARMTIRQEEKRSSETGNGFCRVCAFAGQGVENFLTHLTSNEHANKVASLPPKCF